jgi:hypothetical protein
MSYRCSAGTRDRPAFDGVGVILLGTANTEKVMLPNATIFAISVDMTRLFTLYDSDTQLILFADSDTTHTGWNLTLPYTSNDPLRALANRYEPVLSSSTNHISPEMPVLMPTAPPSPSSRQPRFHYASLHPHFSRS